MKNITLVFVIAVVMSLNVVSAQDSWVQKADFGGPALTLGIGFSIGNKGYFGIGSDSYFQNWLHDFWEYDPASDSWTQKADFPVNRTEAVGFSIGNKGYLTTGFDYNCNKDLWEYDPVSNTWSQKTDCGGVGRVHAVAFSIGSKGYIGTGNICNGPALKDFWEYDPASDSWTQKADLQQERTSAVAFSIGNKGYVGTGGYTYQAHDFWEYNPVSNMWHQIADIPGAARYFGVGFSIGGKGYVGLGQGYQVGLLRDFWRYDPVSDSWNQFPDFIGTERLYASCFSIGDKGYVGIGSTGNNTALNDFWETPDTNSIGCSIPTGEHATEITSTSVKLKWDDIDSAKKYKLRYKIANTNDWIILYPVAHHKLLLGLLPGTTYKWEVRSICHVDSPSLLSPWSYKQEFTTLPFRLSGEPLPQVSFHIFPNPTEDHATIQFTLPQASHIYIKVYDVSGKEIATLLDDDVEQGDHSLLLNTNQFPSGVYLVKMITGLGIVHGTPYGETQKLIVQ